MNPPGDSSVPSPSFVAGLCSVTLRGCVPEEVVDVAAGAGLTAIEWGGDVHVPSGDLGAAAEVAARTDAAGLVVGSYGSYLFAAPDVADDDISRVVDTAAALGAPWVRIWCPFGVEPGAPPPERSGVVAAVARVAERAAAAGLAVYTEFHGQTLTATEDSAAELLAQVDAPNLFTAWQPPYWDPARPVGRPGDDVAADLAGIARLAPRLANVHVYAWDHDLSRAPLAGRGAAWRARLDAAAAAGAAAVAPRLALLEFVPDDDPALVAGEAATLRAWLADAADAAAPDQPVTVPWPESEHVSPVGGRGGGRGDGVRLSERIRPGREIVGMSAVLLPFTADGAVDWAGFEGLLDRTLEAGLVPAVNMDTGFGPVLSSEERRRVLGVARDRCPPDVRGDRFLAGAHVDDEPGAVFDAAAHRSAMAEIAAHGGTPILFPSFGLASLPEPELAPAHAALAAEVDRLYGFELGPMFHPAGRIWSLDTFAEILAIPAVVGAKHSSLRRAPELERLVVRDQRRPGFRVLTGNDLAIDQVIYGSDYLLGLSAFAPDAFARRDRAWVEGDELVFWELNDVLQYLGQLAFRPPVPGYRHDAAMFLRRRGWIASDRTHPRSPRRPDADRALLHEVADRVEALLADLAS
ncbi:MAG: TIM barrel protein [Acidimicrobiales bacterium]